MNGRGRGGRWLEAARRAAQDDHHHHHTHARQTTSQSEPVHRSGGMRVCGGVRACVSVLLIALSAAAAPDSSATWVRAPQPPPPQQTLHGLMTSIDERLHTLESVRWESMLKQVEQRLESLETTFRRLDTGFQDRLDKLERNLNSKELKDELTVEKLSHKVRDILDSSYDRYNRRLGYTEERLEMSLNKVQMSVEGILNRIEKEQEDMQADVTEAVTILEDLKLFSSSSDDKLNSTHKAIQQHIQGVMSPSQEELQRISSTLENLGAQLNHSVSTWGSIVPQSDGPQSDLLTSVRSEINTEANKLTSKLNNMYNDIWRRVVSMESLVKDVSRLGNTTQREVLEEVRSLMLNDRQDLMGTSQENFLEVAIDALERKLQRRLSELGRRVDDRLDTLTASQNLVMDSCFEGGICSGLEARLSQVLERIFDVYSQRIEGISNRTLDLDDLVLEMMGLVKTQHSQLLRTVTHNTNMVVKLTKDTSDANKLVHSTVSQLMEKTDYNLQEILDEVQEMSNNSNKICKESDKTRENIKQNGPDKIVIPTITEKNSTKEDYEGDILKITDDILPLADNSTYFNEIQTKVTEPSFPKVVDTSIIQVINMISPNLTEYQLDALLKFLNSSISVENLDTVIQNTEAESEENMISEGTSIKMYDAPDSLNNTEIYEDNEILNQSETSGEIESLSEENDLNGTTEMTTAQNYNSTETFILNKKESNPPGISNEMKEHFKIYTLLLRIKNGFLNTRDIWQIINKKFENQTDHNSKKNLIPMLQKLCYGEEKDFSFTIDKVNDLMRSRLLLINQTIKDTDLYEKIENICNTMTESLLMPNKSDKFSFDNQQT